MRPWDHEAGVLAGGGAAVLTLPVLVLGLGAPVWGGLLGALAAGAAAASVGTVIRRASPAGRIEAAGRNAVEAVLAEAEPALDRLRDAAPSLPKGIVRTRAERIATTARTLIEDVQAEPARLSTVQRLLTYYLPSAAGIAEGYRVLEAQGSVRPDRLSAMEAVLAKLEDAFRQGAQRLMDEDLRLLDGEIRLIEEALREDLGDRP